MAPVVHHARRHREPAGRRRHLHPPTAHPHARRRAQHAVDVVVVVVGHAEVARCRHVDGDARPPGVELLVVVLDRQPSLAHPPGSAILLLDDALPTPRRNPSRRAVDVACVAGVTCVTPPPLRPPRPRRRGRTEPLRVAAAAFRRAARRRLSRTRPRARALFSARLRPSLVRDCTTQRACEFESVRATQRRTLLSVPESLLPVARDR